jgi:hypothetical protein
MASNIKEQLKDMDYEDRATYLEVVERRLEEVDRIAGEMSKEAGAIKEFIDSDPVANYRGKKYGQKVELIYMLDKYGKFPDSVTKKQAELILMGRELKPSIVSTKGRVPWEYVIDELADHFKMGEQEFVSHVENIAEQKTRLNDMDGLIKEAEDRKKELEEIREAICKYNHEQCHIDIEELKVKQEIGQPEAGLQKGMLGEDKEIRPQGKGKVT